MDTECRAEEVVERLVAQRACSHTQIYVRGSM